MLESTVGGKVEMRIDRRAVVVFIVAGLVGCKSAQPTVSAANGGGDGGTAIAADGGVTKASYASGTQKKYVTDPTLNGMNAAEVTVPANWHFQGVLYQGGNCVTIPSPVFRTTSPDGLSFVERLPPLGWFWGQGPFIQFMPKSDCLPMKGPMSAQEFTKYLAATMKLNYLADEPMPEEVVARVQKNQADADAAYAPKYAAMNVKPPKNTVELARAVVSSKNGTFTMKGRLTVTVNCTETYQPGMKSILRGMPDRAPSTVDKCTANVNYAAAPESQYAALVKSWDTNLMGAKLLDAWQEAWVQRNQEKSQRMINNMIQQSNAQMAAQHAQFEHDQAVRQQMHEQFMQTMQRGTDMSMARTQANADARSQSTSDWVDYALDRQTVVDPGTGQVSKVSSTYSHTWVDETGKTSYQTNDVNANPNGVLPGTWTQQTKTHGDGTPY
jgi:hypothetical protein